MTSRQELMTPFEVLTHMLMSLLNIGFLKYSLINAHDFINLLAAKEDRDSFFACLIVQNFNKSYSL